MNAADGQLVGDIVGAAITLISQIITAIRENKSMDETQKQAAIAAIIGRLNQDIIDVENVKI